MPQDFRSARQPTQSIGFHELRQACEISTLREDLERVVNQSQELRGFIEEAVEQVRTRFASLTPEELADSAAMAPLLQFAVAQLVALRDRARTQNVRTGPVPDDDRSLWLAAEPPGRSRPPFAERPFTDGPLAPPQPEPPPPAPAPAPPDPPPPPLPVTPPPAAGKDASSWLAPPGLRAPARPTPGPHRDSARPNAIDWLQPARR